MISRGVDASPTRHVLSFHSCVVIFVTLVWIFPLSKHIWQKKWKVALKWFFLNPGLGFSRGALKTPACSRLCFEAECAHVFSPLVLRTASKDMHVASHLVHSNLQQGFSHLALKHFRHSEYAKEEYLYLRMILQLLLLRAGRCLGTVQNTKEVSF